MRLSGETVKYDRTLSMANSEMQAQFVATGGQKLPAKKPRSTREVVNETRTKVRRKPIAEVTPERRGFWHGVMTTKLRQQEEHPDFGGFYWCQCGAPDCNSQIEGFDEARRFFQPGHLKPRASFNHKGFRLRYVPTLGPDDPDNIVPVSPSCNASEFWDRQGQPQWTEAS